MAPQGLGQSRPDVYKSRSQLPEPHISACIVRQRVHVAGGTACVNNCQRGSMWLRDLVCLCKRACRALRLSERG